jgi:(S)-mandelate dehydrogenase
MMVGVAAIDTATEIAGAASSLPIVIAPTGAPGFAWPRADIAIARAAAAFRIPCILSSSATCSLEDVAREAGGRLWFQPYILRDRPFFERLIDRAEAAGYEALVLTVDMPAGGNRERDFRNDFGIPFQWTVRNVSDFASRPRWALAMLRHGVPTLPNLAGLDRSGPDLSGAASSVGRNYDPDFDWRGFEAIRRRWPRTLFVKGLLHPADAARAVEVGVNGIVVSNHGGRQLDGAIAALDALPAIVESVAGRVPVLVDSGIRRGADIVKARALGAAAVMIGRPTLYGVAAAGEAGAHRALAILEEELVRTMRLCGTRSVRNIDASLLAPAAA